MGEGNAEGTHREGRLKSPKHEFKAFREVEIHKALDTLSPGKAPGADAIPAAAYQKLRELLPLLKQLITAMVCGEQIPKPLLEIIIVPLDKPGKSPNACDAKRPISLIQ